MNMKSMNRKSTLLFLFASMMMSSPIFSSLTEEVHIESPMDTTEDNDQSDRCPLRKARFSESEKIAKMRQKETKIKEQIKKKREKLSIADEEPTAKCLAYPRGFAGSTYHLLKDRSPRGDSITLPDGSVWVISDFYHNAVKNWTKQQSVTIMPNSQWFPRFGKTDYAYMIHNASTNDYVETNISQGPLKSSPATLQIVKIDKYANTVYLTNNSCFRVSQTQSNHVVFNGWQLGDYVILGKNNTGWFSFGNQDIIINVSADNYAEAQRAY